MLTLSQIKLVEGIFIDSLNRVATINEGFEDSGFPKELIPEARKVIDYLETEVSYQTIELDFKEDEHYQDVADVVRLLRNAGFAANWGESSSLTIYTTRLHSLDAAQFFLTFSGLDWIAESF